MNDANTQGVDILRLCILRTLPYNYVQLLSAQHTGNHILKATAEQLYYKRNGVTSLSAKSLTVPNTLLLRTCCQRSAVLQ
jgi:hypothetical protein